MESPLAEPMLTNPSYPAHAAALICVSASCSWECVVLHPVLRTIARRESMTAQTGAERLIDGLITWGVDTVFGMPGDGINGVMEAIRRRKDEIRFIQVRHEESAALMACAHAKWTGKLGCCL